MDGVNSMIYVFSVACKHVIPITRNDCEQYRKLKILRKESNLRTLHSNCPDAGSGQRTVTADFVFVTKAYLHGTIVVYDSYSGVWK